MTSADKSPATDPGGAAAHFSRGNELQRLGQLDAALASYDRAILAKADFAQAHSNRGIALITLGRLSEALASLDRAIAIKSEFPEAYVGRGNAFKELNRLDEALASYDRAIQLRSDYADAHVARAVSRLLSGDFSGGWKDFEWRWQRASGPNGLRSRDFTEPLWLGGESVAGMTLLIYCEIGLGDTVHFCRYVTLLAQFQATVILQVQAPLVELLADLPGAARVLAEDHELPAFDYRCPLLSLPLALDTQLDTIPAPRKYLRSDPVRAEHWRVRLGDRGRPRVGLVWRGDPNNRDDRNRSMSLTGMLEQLPSDVQYYSLQKTLSESERLTIQAHPALCCLADELNFAETAALCESLDLVISVDTSLAHVSAALGRPTWILLPFSPDCRWLLNRKDSPWYPTVTLYRQDTIGDWHGPLARVAADLRREPWPYFSSAE